MAKRTSNLTKKEEKFVEEYMKDYNAKRAYMVAFSCDNPNSARASGSRLLTNANIKDAISERVENMKNKYVGIREKIIERNINILFQDFTNVVKTKTHTISGLPIQSVVVKDVDELTEEQKLCIKSITQTKDGIKIEFESRDKAEDKIIELLGLNKESDKKENEYSFDVVSFKNASLEELKAMLNELRGQ